MTLGRIFDELSSCWHFADIRKKPCGTLSPQQVLANISCHSVSQTNSVKTGLKTSIGAMRRSILARLQAPRVSTRQL